MYNRHEKPTKIFSVCRRLQPAKVCLLDWHEISFIACTLSVGLGTIAMHEIEFCYILSSWHHNVPGKAEFLHQEIPTIKGSCGHQVQFFQNRLQSIFPAQWKWPVASKGYVEVCRCRVSMECFLLTPPPLHFIPLPQEQFCVLCTHKIVQSHGDHIGAQWTEKRTSGC